MTEKTERPTTKKSAASEADASDKAQLAITVDPASGPVQTALVITGPGFGETPGRITLNEVPAPPLVWGDLAIQTIVPYGATSGDLMVITADGRRASVPFTVTEA